VTRYFRDLRTTYLAGDVVVVEDLPPGTLDVTVTTSWGDVIGAVVVDGVATVEGLPEGTHAFAAFSEDGQLLDEEFVGVRLTKGDDPVMGFVTSFDEASRESVLTWLRDLRCTVVQVYDWMETYTSPLASTSHYRDPLGRSIERAALEDLIEGIKDLGAVAQAYAPVCAADDAFASSHPQWLLFRNDGAPESLGTLLQIMNPANPGWQQHWIESYSRGLDALGFDGMHLDTYGYPRAALNVEGEPASVESGYAEFVASVRTARPDDVISFNQVNGVPRGFVTPTSPSFRYSEVWPPNDRWRHLEGLLARSAGNAATTGDVLAIYPPVWLGDRADALRTCVLSEAVVTTLGASTLQWGDADGVLRHPYYVDHEALSGDERATALEWHRFALRCRDLWTTGKDTSWYELTDENAAVIVTSSVLASPEPLGGGLFCRVRRGDDRVAVALVDLTGSADGSWSSGSRRGTCRSAEVSILVDSPEEWCAQVAVLASNGGRFVDVATNATIHREGRAVTIAVPMETGWSVVRLRRVTSLT
jgi:dextranase